MALNRSKHQRIVPTPRYVNGKVCGYTYTVESRDDACQRISERSNKQALAQNRSIGCNLTEDHKRITKNAEWRLGKLQKAIDTEKESLSRHTSYKIVLRAIQQQEVPTSRMCKSAATPALITQRIVEEEGLFGCYGYSYYERLLPEIETVRAITSDGGKRRRLLSRRLLDQRKPMEYIDRTLTNSQYYISANKMVEPDRSECQSRQPLSMREIEANFCTLRVK